MRSQRAAGIEDLAKRLAAGEMIPPEDIEATLDEAGTHEEVLQAAIDRIERRAALLAAVSRGRAAETKADRLREDIDKAAGEMNAAHERLAAVLAKHAESLAAFDLQAAEGLRAAESLLEPENLSPADRERLGEARKTASDAAQAAGDLRRRMPELRMSLEQAEHASFDAVEHARLDRSNADAQDHKAGCENAVKARKARLADAEAELPKLVAEAERLAAVVERIEDEMRR